MRYDKKKRCGKGRHAFKVTTRKKDHHIEICRKCGSSKTVYGRAK